MSSIIRREFKKGDDIRDAGLTAPDDVIQYKDIAYGKDSAMQDGTMLVCGSCSVRGALRKLLGCIFSEFSLIEFCIDIRKRLIDFRLLVIDPGVRGEV